MTGKERFTVDYDITTGNYDIHDKKKSNGVDGYIAYLSDEERANNLCDLLNEQEKRINELKETIIKITHSYHQKHDNTIVNLVDEVYEENIGDLFIEWNHGDVE